MRHGNEETNQCTSDVHHPVQYPESLSPVATIKHKDDLLLHNLSSERFENIL